MTATSTQRALKLRQASATVSAWQAQLAMDRIASIWMNATPTLVSSDAIPADQIGLDIGPESAVAFAAAIKKCKTVFWNGPMGRL